jgi:hypothetical protein
MVSCIDVVETLYYYITVSVLLLWLLLWLLLLHCIVLCFCVAVVETLYYYYYDTLLCYVCLTMYFPLLFLLFVSYQSQSGAFLSLQLWHSQHIHFGVGTHRSMHNFRVAKQVLFCFVVFCLCFVCCFMICLMFRFVAEEPNTPDFIVFDQVNKSVILALSRNKYIALLTNQIRQNRDPDFLVRE